MFRKLSVIAMVAVSSCCLWGCDDSNGVVTADVAKLMSAAKPDFAGSTMMNQILQRDRLMDGTGENCQGGGTQGTGGSGTGQGSGDQARLRDGSCGR